jgi:predicted helicase
MDNFNDLLRQMQKVDWTEELKKQEIGIKFLILKDENVRESVDELIVWLQMRAHGLIVSKDDIVQLLVIHLTTKPMFDAIFNNKELTALNSLTGKINKILDAMRQHFLQPNPLK